MKNARHNVKVICIDMICQKSVIVVGMRSKKENRSETLRVNENAHKNISFKFYIFVISNLSFALI